MGVFKSLDFKLESPRYIELLRGKQKGKGHQATLSITDIQSTKTIYFDSDFLVFKLFFVALHGLVRKTR